jgi:carbon storage regulator CsrA
MLLVARRVGEALRIGQDIEVKVVASGRSRVLLAVSAPREIEIRRVYGKSDYKLSDDPDADSTPAANLLELQTAEAPRKADSTE